MPRDAAPVSQISVCLINDHCSVSNLTVDLDAHAQNKLWRPIAKVNFRKQSLGTNEVFTSPVFIAMLLIVSNFAVVCNYVELLHHV